ncbi:cytochrome P450 [Truncatella angustata]|uniref:Cytochrome P450 n=1 Tax=Truncatella angustata TaxID=152316 RepID=A0A9P8UV25_9PEZI|nr:cytochrome P450 [Truncatella angustata]KAH6658887.1 cytochrome P450 [Truncatella angustata]
MSIQLLVTAVGCVAILALVQSLLSPLRSIGGPFLARFTDLWYGWRVYSGHFEIENLELHKKHVRYGPNRFSFDDPDVLRTIYGPGSQFKKSDWYDAFNLPKPLAFEQWNIFSTTDPKLHSEQRKPFTSNYSMSALVSFEPYVDQCADIFDQRLTEVVDTGVPIDYSHWLQCYAFDVIGDITFGKRFGFLDSGHDVGGVMAALDTSFTYSATVGVFPSIHPYLFKLMGLAAGKKNTGMQYVNAFTEDSIKEFRNKPKTSKAASENNTGMKPLLDKFFKKHEEDPAHFSSYHIYTGAATNVGAGSDTTGISLSATFYYLLKNPGTLRKLRDEIDDKSTQGQLSDRPTFKETQGMPYLQAVIKEALRLHPATGLPLERVVPEGGAIILGRFFPEGTIVGVNTWVEHRNKQVWGEDAERFRPERWFTDDTERMGLMNRHWIPFGAGSRVCIGKNISLLEMQKLIPRVVRDFNLEIEGGNHRTWDTLNHWFVKPINFRVKVSKRKKE